MTKDNTLIIKLYNSQLYKVQSGKVTQVTFNLLFS